VFTRILRNIPLITNNQEFNNILLHHEINQKSYPYHAHLSGIFFLVEYEQKNKIKTYEAYRH
jgi:hypothetical protein